MFGWAIISGCEEIISNSTLKHIDRLELEGRVIDIYQNPFPKFEKDKINYQDDDCYILLDGVIFNNHKLIEEYKKSSWELTIKEMYLRTMDASFVNKLRGSFNGIIIDKKNKNIFVFTNHLGEREVFYKIDEIFNLITSNFNFLHEALNFYNIPYSVEKEAVLSMISYAHMVDDFTYIKNVKRLLAGSFISINLNNKNNFKINNYHKFTTSKLIEDMTDDELIDIIDKTFNNAFIMQMEKDKEYGYRSIIDVSGGYDSRVVAFAAKRFNYKDVVTLSYSQNKSNENKVVGLVIEKLNYDYYYKALDYPSFIFELSEIVSLNYGLTLYAAITGGKQFLQDINHERLGIEHTGLLGDVYDGSFNSVSKRIPAEDYPRYRYNKSFDYHIDKKYLDKYEDFETMAFQMRGLNFGLGTHLIRRNYNETFSAFMDVDVLELMFSIPLDKRMDEKIFIKWMNKYYPEAADIIYAKTMTTHKDNEKFLWLKNKINITLPYYWNQLLVKLSIKKNYVAVNSMNPFDYWYDNIEEVKSFIDSYILENKHLMDEFPELENLNSNILNSNVFDKTIYMTALEALKQYFGDGK